jgi:hypothetical protein
MFVNAINMSLLWNENNGPTRERNKAPLERKPAHIRRGLFSPSNVSRYNAPHLLSSPQHLQRLRFTGNSIVHTSWCEEV